MSAFAASTVPEEFPAEGGQRLLQRHRCLLQNPGGLEGLGAFPDALHADHL